MSDINGHGWCLALVCFLFWIGFTCQWHIFVLYLIHDMQRVMSFPYFLSIFYTLGVMYSNGTWDCAVVVIPAVPALVKIAS